MEDLRDSELILKKQLQNRVLIVGAPDDAHECEMMHDVLTKLGIAHQIVDKEISKEKEMNNIAPYMGLISGMAGGLRDMYDIKDIGIDSRSTNAMASFGMRYSNSRKAKTRKIKNKRRKK